MDDLLRRLRSQGPMYSTEASDLRKQAADEIERLRRVEQAYERLKKTARQCDIEFSEREDPDDNG